MVDTNHNQTKYLVLPVFAVRPVCFNDAPDFVNLTVQTTCSNEARQLSGDKQSIRINNLEKVMLYFYFVGFNYTTNMVWLGTDRPLSLVRASQEQLYRLLYDVNTEYSKQPTNIKKNTK